MNDKRIAAALVHIEAALSFIVAQARIHGATALTENALRELQKGTDLLCLRTDQIISNSIDESKDVRRKTHGDRS